MPLRKLAAAARAALLAAAAQQWELPLASLQTSAGSVIDSTNSERRASYASLLVAAKRQPLQADPPLRTRAQWRVIGTRPTRRDTAAKTDGSASFGIDVQLPDMLVGVVLRAPALGVALQSFDARRSLRASGVRKVLRISNGVVVLAGDFWSACRGRELLTVQWTKPSAHDSSVMHEQRLQAPLASPGTVARHQGDPERLESGAGGRFIRADYFAPFLAHAALEPLACTAWVQADRCDVWVGTQAPSRAQNHASELTGLPLDRVFVHTLPIGGAFGRRGEWDWVVEAVEAAKLAQVPVKLVWTREDDLRHDFYRPASAHRLVASLQSDGLPELLTHRIAATSVARRRSPEMLLRGPDTLITQGSHDTDYRLPNLRVDYHDVDLGVPVGFWRSVGHSYNGFVIESFIDELAHAAGRDPLEYRLALLSEEPRMAAVLRRVAQLAGWSGKPADSRGQGIACLKSYGSYVAQVAQVAVVDGAVIVERVCCAVDAGVVVHPGIVEQQMHSGIVFGLSAALGGEIKFVSGAVQQSNFHDYPPLRMQQMPQIDVAIIESDAAPGGCGEPAAPVIAPAVANAIFSLTGKRLRRLPLKL
jgi:CO/xanthine dehydrogenase Mo-binding subunit